jgi:CDP-diacylglycerol--serine O-phosphatidyltransferase
MTTQQRAKRAVGLHILPSSMTVLAICAGLTSIKFALDGQPHIAMALIGAAAILDGLDGRVARILDASSRMGAEIDSLADAVNFGVAPAVVVYVSLLSPLAVGWIVVLVYAVCVVLRLARFNTLLDDVSLPGYTREFFVGMPAPAGAIALIGLLAAKLQFGDGWWTAQWFVCACVVICSVLLVSRIPMKKMHAIAVPPNLAAVLLAVLALVAAAAFLFPYILVLVLIVAYLCHVPFAIRSQRWVAAHPEAWEDKPKQRRAARRAIRRAQPNRRSMARLGLRKPGGRPMPRLAPRRPGR